MAVIRLVHTGLEVCLRFCSHAKAGLTATSGMGFRMEHMLNALKLLRNVIICLEILNLFRDARFSR
jgi:hypothetical protein